MNPAEYLSAYAQGWSRGDADMILQATAEGYTFDDPNAGHVTREAFSEYLVTLKEAIAAQCHGRIPEPFMELSEVLTQEEAGVLTASCWWAVPGTTLKGSGLIKVDANGVRSEVITYYAKPGG
ncbi:nuclear transport factor 2 family protein [Halomonas nitroreducens]|uniref:Nuclear transport factor 2 family protein n=1 Tax=Halomonas nitroreducens TaxID=447425 RepID=A0A3S0JVQ8_9GAMM|nr:nuclear transport factor 2 family protein [Halomonas nitroreducens]RTQ99863.1 nuclear transport factor 2 family protein [Halomonas nitroreducens]